MKQDNLQFNIDESAETAETRKRSGFWDFLLWLIIIVLATAILIRIFVVSNVTVSGESMTAGYYNLPNSEYYNPDLTYHDEDVVMVNKVCKLQRGDVVVFYKYPVKSKFLAMFARGKDVEADGQYYKLIKRVVALGGDRIWLDNEGLEEGKYRLVVQTPDGTIRHEDYYRKNGTQLSADCFIISTNGKSGPGRLADCTEQNPLIIDEGYFFAVGDNRDNSADSRGELGPVPLSQLFGVVIDKNTPRIIIKGLYFSNN